MTAPCTRERISGKNAARLLNQMRDLLQQRGRCGRWCAPETLCALPAGHLEDLPALPCGSRLGASGAGHGRASTGEGGARPTSHEEAA